MQSEASVTLRDRHLAAAICCLTAALALGPIEAQAEICRFSGTTTAGGKLSVRAETTEMGGQITVDVTVALAIAALTSDIIYYGQEITTWSHGELQSVAVNQRTLIDGVIKRQQWDVFRRNAGKLEAYRVQAKRLPEFRQRHPGFVAHWAPSTFGQPWLGDYAAAAPERRPDLDLHVTTSGVQTPLALAFYWSRFLPQPGATMTLLLPSFKHDPTAALHFDPAAAGDGWSRWSTPLVHSGLNSTPASLAAAWVSPTHYLLQLGFEVHTGWASGTALLHAEGCQGVQNRP